MPAAASLARPLQKLEFVPGATNVIDCDIGEVCRAATNLTDLYMHQNASSAVRVNHTFT